MFKHLQAWWWLLTRKPCFDAAKIFLNFLKMRTIEFAEKFGSSQKGKCLKFHFFEIRRIVITRKWRQWNRLLERVSKSYLHMRPQLRFVQLWFPMWDRILLKLVLMPAEATVLSTKELWYRTKMWAWQFKKHRLFFYISKGRTIWCTFAGSQTTNIWKEMACTNNKTRFFLVGVHFFTKVR